MPSHEGYKDKGMKKPAELTAGFLGFLE